MQTSAIDLSGRLETAVGWLAGSNRRAVIALFVFALLCFLPGFASFPVTSRDESRFAQPAKQMIETGDYIDIRLQERSRYRKPIGIYWLQAGTVRLAEAVGFDDARARIVFYRLPSLVAAVGSVLLTYWMALVFVRRRYAFFAGAALASSTLLGVEARIATIDASLLLSAMMAFGALARFYLRTPEENGSARGEWALAGLFWTGIAGSILLKGPVISLIALFTVLSLSVADRSARWLLRLKPLPGILWALLLVLPWFLAILSQSDGGFYRQSVGRDFLGRLLEGAEGHWGPPGYFWLLFWVSFWPAAVIAPMATAFAWAERREPALRFLIAWILPGWLMFEIVVTKLPHYVLPLYPGFAILIALALERRVTPDGWTKGTGALWPILTIALTVAAVVLAALFEGDLGKAFWPAAALAIALSGLAWWRLIGGDAERGLTLALIAAMANAFVVYSTLPRIKALAVSHRLVETAQAAPCPNPMLASAGYHEPNLVFLGGTDTRLVDGGGAAEFLQPGGCRIAFVERRDERAFAERAAAIGLVTMQIGTVSGFDYSNWRSVSFVVLMPKQAP